MSDLTKYRYELADDVWNDEPNQAELDLTDRFLASETLARIIADAKAEVATAIESLHYDAPAARIAQATAARIARGGAQ